jgi:hypothetical protein
MLPCREQQERWQWNLTVLAPKLITKMPLHVTTLWARLPFQNPPKYETQKEVGSGPNKGKEHPADVNIDSWTSSGYKALDKLGVIFEPWEASSLSL